jgi:hypothetical protein
MRRNAAVRDVFRSNPGGGDSVGRRSSGSPSGCRDDIAERPAQFIESLEKMLGGGSTRIIESAMTELQREFGLVSPAREEFVDVVSRATRSG